MQPMLRGAAYRVALLGLRAWWVVARPRSSGVRCVLRHGGAIVLVRHGYGDRRWMLPGGRARAGEPPVAAAAREMGQELGVRASGWREVGAIPARRGGWRRPSRDEPFRRHATTYVAGEVAGRTLAPRRGEIAEAAWFDVSALPEDRQEELDLAVAAGWV